ncbi:MAG: hypothetical protein HOQ24_00415 [Mycobacteriaceae bacterium]|nr:hypothetical protein [Mycobacteriaceae bacterium]
MTFRDDAQFNADQVQVSRSGGGGFMGPGMIGLGGGAAGLVLLVLTLLLGGDPGAALNSLDQGGDGSAQQGAARDTAHCRTGADANTSVDCRILFTMQSLNDVWSAQLPAQAGKRYTPPKVNLFKGSVSTGCGPATSSVGPFYCPADHTAYFDTDFFRTLVNRFGSSGGPLAQEYVVAHEVGHAVQNQLGLLSKVQSSRHGPTSAAVRSELQADCLAGVWAHYAASTPAPGGGRPLLHELTDKDVKDALSAASAVGDDRIQSASRGGVSPESWTHGSSAQRQAWLLSGYRSGSMRACDTFSAGDLNNPAANHPA